MRAPLLRPPLSRKPRSPINVPKPSGGASMKAAAGAAPMARSPASGSEKAMLSRMLPMSSSTS